MEAMELQEDDGSDAVPDFQGPGRRGPGGEGRELRLEPNDGRASWPEYLVYFKQMADVQGSGPREGARGALRKSFCPMEQLHHHQTELKGLA